MKKILCTLALTITLGLLSFKGIQAQKHAKGSKTASVAPDKTPYTIPFLVDPLAPASSSQQAINRQVQQNSSLPFSMRFPRPERKSSKFHYPALPNVYWTLHKRPEVPLIEPENELGFGYTDYE